MPHPTPTRPSASAEAMIKKWSNPEHWEKYGMPKKEPSEADWEAVIKPNGKTQIRSKSTGQVLAEQG